MGKQVCFFATPSDLKQFFDSVSSEIINQKMGGIEYGIE